MMMIYDLPMIALFAAGLEQPSKLRTPALTRLTFGDDRFPLFIAHGLGGNVTELCELARCLQTRRSIYGMQARGTDGAGKPLVRIEDMADLHLEEIKRLQSRGPYFLAGYSMGGLVALEIARTLIAKREDVGLLVMIDSYPHWRRLARGQQWRVLRQRVARRALAARERLTQSLRRKRDSGDQRSAVEAPITKAMRRVAKCSYLALRRYQPRFYEGKVQFMRAKVVTIFPEDPAAVWGPLLGQLEIETVPGDHHELLTTHVGSLAASLSRLLLDLDD